MSIEQNKTGLVLDTTNRWIIAGLFNQDRSLYDRIEAPRDSFTKIMPLLSDLFSRFEINAPDWIAVSAGPGSFTGTRIGIAVARNLSQILQIPVLGFDTIASYHHFLVSQESDSGNAIAILLDGKQKRVYARTFDSDRKTDLSASPLDVNPGELILSLPKETRIFTDDKKAIIQYAQSAGYNIDENRLEALPPPTAKDLFEYVLNSGGLKNASTWETCLPLYVRSDPATAMYPDGFQGKINA